MMKFFVKFLFVLLVAGAVFSFSGLVILAQMTRTLGPLEQAKIIYIPPGSGTSGIGQILTQQGVVPRADIFMGAVLFSRSLGKLQAGEYEFPAHISLGDAVSKMARGDVYVRKLTVPEGLSVTQILELLVSAPALVGDVPAAPAEGSLLPETYTYTYGTKRADMVARMQKSMTDLVTPLWVARHPDFPLKNINDVLTLASIIEKETGKADERPHVASVFFNRLQLGMKLQSDPTVIYALTSGHAPLDRALTTKDLTNTKSPYNTYVAPGLPPGPIANPGAASIRAVFAPALTSDLYFVADGTGGHVFAATLDDHNKNVSKWRKIQKEKREGEGE